ncbi:TetR family transcriptional regulator C-terminal domain-containing protein [Actinacidiphila sp. bgisy160]|uniref:TetR family transcriptional regulator C-terminal domain-containing protein n=1 Tax=Actinacidiphila sp. bgisy160 TaxID=3413796 RepID=UPI003D73D778
MRAAREGHIRQVVEPARELPAGLTRVRRLCESWLDRSRRRVFPGGCFLLAVSAEFDARTGPVHDVAAQARRADRLRADADIPLLAFELIALRDTGTLQSGLFDDATAHARAGTATINRLRALADGRSADAEVPSLPARFEG